MPTKHLSLQPHTFRQRQAAVCKCGGKPGLRGTTQQCLRISHSPYFSAKALSPKGELALPPHA